MIAPPAESPKLERTLAGVCTFANGSAQCGSSSTDPLRVTTICDEMLAQAVKTLKQYPGSHVEVVGNHNRSESKDLALLRAKAVGEKLIDEYGLEPTQVVPSVGDDGTRTVKVYVEQ